MAIRASQQPIMGHTWQLPLRVSPERWLTHNDRSELSPWQPEPVNNL